MKRYTPDFPEMMRLCGNQFRTQLRRLLPRNDAPGETVSYQGEQRAVSVNDNRINALHYAGGN